MVLLQYCNLLLHKSADKPNQMDIIGEDRTSSTASNVHLPVDVTEAAEYTSHFSGVTILVCQYKQLTALPAPTTGFFDTLQVIDLSLCAAISRLPSSFGDKGTVTVLNVSGTKLSAIPLTFLPSLTSVDVSNCRRITNIGDTHNLKVLNITASAVVDVQSSTCLTLEQLIALNSKITSISSAPALKVVIWSGPLSAHLQLDGCHQIMTVITTGPIEMIHTNGTPYITSLHL